MLPRRTYYRAVVRKSEDGGPLLQKSFESPTISEWPDRCGEPVHLMEQHEALAQLLEYVAKSLRIAP